MKPDMNSIVYFPFGGDEYKRCKRNYNNGNYHCQITKSISKVRNAIEKDKGADLVIVGHGKEVHKSKTAKLYEKGMIFTNKITASDLTNKLVDGIGIENLNTRTGNIYIWVCYAASNGLGHQLKAHFTSRKLKNSIYAASELIGGIDLWQMLSLDGSFTEM